VAASDTSQRSRFSCGLAVTRAGRVGRELAGTVGRGITPVRLTNVNGDIEIRAARAGRVSAPPAGLNPPRGLAFATAPGQALIPF
jgi:hypothetical protein